MMRFRPALLGLAVALLSPLLPSARAIEAAPLFATHAACAATPLGVAQNYNGFFLNDVDSSGSDTAGRLAVGGNATLTNYSVGTSLDGTLTDPTLVVGGDLQYTRGAVNGDVVYGGTANISHIAATDATQGDPVSFNSAATSITDLASTYAKLRANAKVSGPSGFLNLAGTVKGVNVFHVKGSRLAAARTLRITVPKGATVLVIVRGASSAFRSLGVSLHGVNGARLLFDFPSATALTLMSVGLKASILAPRATINFTDGAVDGTVVGASLTGSGHLGTLPFTGCLPAH